LWQKKTLVEPYTYFFMLPHWLAIIPQGDLATFGYKSAIKVEIYY
jgi:hypothetical protein